MFGKNDEVSVLETLTSTLADSVNGYRESADHSETPDLKQMFRDMADERSALVDELRGEVRRLGGEPDTDGSTSGYLHQRFLDLKATITGRDDKAIVNEVERGEDYLKEKFEAALATEGLSAEIRSAIDRAFQSVRKGHDKVSALKHSLEA